MTTDTSPPGRPVPPKLSEEEQAVRTQRWIHECDQLIALRKSLEEKFPELSPSQVGLYVAELVIGNNLGEDWVERNIHAAGKEGARRSKTSTYLRRDAVDLMQRHERYVRVMELARRLFELGQEHFADLLIDNLRRRDLEGAAFEADVVRMLVSWRAVINLRDEKRTKGDDYDIDVWLTPKTPWAIEVKTRQDSSPYTAKHLLKTLDRARGQLPPKGIGGIFMKVPTPWITDPDYTNNHEAEVIAFLNQTSRVHIIVLVWDVWTPKPSGTGWTWDRAHRIFKAPQIDPCLSGLADFYQRIWGGPDLFAPNAPF